MSLSGLGIFCAVYVVAVATPGPGVAAVVARSLAHGTHGAVAFIAGFVLGDLLWFTVAATGLAALAQAGHGVFTALKYAGAAYLLYLAYRAWTASAPASPAPGASAHPPARQLFLGSLSLTLANPKTIVFFVALLPSVIRLEALTVSGFCELALAISILLPAILGGYVLLAARARSLFHSTRALRALNRGAGVAIAGAALAVAMR